MTIDIVWGTGEGHTALGAFDSALAEAGVHNYNLVQLTSVIPKGRPIREQGTHQLKWDIGDSVAVVLAENESTVSGETIAAGIGWATAVEGGIFYEATAESRGNVEVLIKSGLDTGIDNRSEWEWEDGVETRVVEHTVEDNGAAIVAAIYQPLKMID